MNRAGLSDLEPRVRPVRQQENKGQSQQDGRHDAGTLETPRHVLQYEQRRDAVQGRPGL